MHFGFAYELAGEWPPLAWIAVCERGSPLLRIIAGAGVEQRQNWFCEAVWDAPFSDGNFDQTDVVFGSGARLREDQVIFVSAGSTVDRLQFAIRGKRTVVSNSLACLMETIDESLSPGSKGYCEFFEAIDQGIECPLHELPCVGGPIQLAYYTNLRWDGSRLQTVSKPTTPRDFTRFHGYTGFMRSVLRRIAENMSSAERAISYSWLGTISQGYDSPACSVLARSAGLREVITHDQSRPGENDDGTGIAEALGLKCIQVNRLAWKDGTLFEPLFLAADAQGKEIMIAGAGRTLNKKVFITGHAGDTAWSMHAPPGNNLARITHSGLSMTEYRLHRGFIHLPLPFIGLGQLTDLVQLSRSPEMKPWDVGGTYNRPICRRLIEEAGVRREAFGITKTGASIRFLRGEDGWSVKGRAAFFEWLKIHRRGYQIHLTSLVQGWICFLVLGFALRFSQRGPTLIRRACRRLGYFFAHRIREEGLNDLAFVWAAETVTDFYRGDRITQIAPDRQC
jgi:hypothetical protein